MFGTISFGKADVFLGGGILAGGLSFIPDLKYALQIILLLAGICSAVASAYYYIVAARKINRK